MMIIIHRNIYIIVSVDDQIYSMTIDSHILVVLIAWYVVRSMTE